MFGSERLFAFAKALMDLQGVVGRRSLTFRIIFLPSEIIWQLSWFHIRPLGLRQISSARKDIFSREVVTSNLPGDEHFIRKKAALPSLGRNPRRA